MAKEVLPLFVFDECCKLQEQQHQALLETKLIFAQA
jgi:hypothetical protein